MAKNNIGTVKQYDYIRRMHRQQTALEMGKALTRSESYVYRLCLELEVIPLTRCREGYGKKKERPQSGKPMYTRKYMANPGPRTRDIERPPAIYTNSPSPFGIADELHGHNLKANNGNDKS